MSKIRPTHPPKKSSKASGNVQLFQAPAPLGACSIGAAVSCPKGGSCQGNQCCPDGAWAISIPSTGSPGWLVLAGALEHGLEKMVVNGG